MSMIEIVNADFLEIAKHLPTPDSLITDPPYADHVHKNTTSVNTAKGRGVTHRDLGFASLTPELRAAISDLGASARRWTAVFSDVESTHEWRSAMPKKWYVRTVPWIRWSQPQLSGDRPPTGCEMVSLFHPPSKKSWNGSGGTTHFAHAAVKEKGKYTAEKPLDLMLELVCSFSDPGDLVVDPNSGVGTTALACKLLGRDCIAIEIDPEVAARASERLADPWERDVERARRWFDANIEEAANWPEPKDKSQRAAYERMQRRLRDLRSLLVRL